MDYRCKPVDVVFALTGDVRRNSRAIKQLRLLRALGLTVTVFSLVGKNDAPHLPVDVQLSLLPRPAGGGPQFFRKVRQTFLQAALKTAARVYHASDLYTLRALRLAAKKHDGALVYDARELYPHVASTAGRPWVRAYWQWTERRDIRSADAVFTVSDSIAKRLQHSYGISRPPVLHNVPPSQKAIPSGKLRQRAKADSDKVLILHQGSIQKGRGCFLLADAMHDVRGAVLVFMGGGPQKPALVEMIQTQGLEERIRMIPRSLPMR